MILGADGAPVDIQKVVQLESHRLIEDFMLLANETVAREAEKRKLPIPYRVHESPAPDRMEELREVSRYAGLSRCEEKGYSQGPSEGSQSVEGKPEAALVSTVVLRSMARARYQPKNLGPFRPRGRDLHTLHLTHPTLPGPSWSIGS